MNNDLDGKCVLVTGGGSGLGAALCHALAAAGADVVAADLREDAAEKVASSVRSQGWRCTAARLDVGDEAAVGVALEQVVAQFGRLDVLVNNAGTDGGVAGGRAAGERLASRDRHQPDRAIPAVAPGPALHETAKGGAHREYRLHGGEAGVAQRLGLPRQQVGPARSFAGPPRRAAAARDQGDERHRRRHAHPVPAGPFSRHRRGDPAGSGRRRRDGEVGAAAALPAPWFRRSWCCRCGRRPGHDSRGVPGQGRHAGREPPLQRRPGAHPACRRGAGSAGQAALGTATCRWW